MTRSRVSARKAGASFERVIADYLAATVDERIDRRVRNGAKDRGDIAGLRSRGRRVVVEVKNCARLDLPGWVREAQTEAGNDDAICGVVVHKRRGSAIPGDQWVTMTVADFAALMGGECDG